MAARRTDVLDIREMVRRFKLAQSDREVARDLGSNRRSVAKYRKFAQAQGWITAAELPTAGEIDARLAALTPNVVFGPESSVEPYRARIAALRAKGVEIQAILQILQDEHRYPGSYSSVRRFVERLEVAEPEAFVRVETAAGVEAQVDFGYAGVLMDPASGQKRRAWVFVMTLGFSRHQYAEIVFDQKVETWLALHMRAFEWFGGVVGRVVIDNLKSAITKACFHDPLVQRSYRELAEHYDFTIAPCQIETPEHKGKVESGVRYVKRNALAGREFSNIHAANEHLKTWIMTRAGGRDHGTTHEAPLALFEIEKPALKPLPVIRYTMAVWKKAKLHPDCHVVFEQAFYSAPHRLIGQGLTIKAMPERLEIYHHHELVATHPRARRAGQRVSNFLHYPPTKLAGLLATPVRVREQAQEIGPHTAQLIGLMLDDKPVDRLRAAMGVVSLVKRYTPARVEAACRRSLACGEASFRGVNLILKKSLDLIPLPPEAEATRGPVPKTAQFARPIREIAAGL
jgi:transposase